MSTKLHCPRCHGRGFPQHMHIEEGRCFYCGTLPALPNIGGGVTPKLTAEELAEARAQVQAEYEWKCLLDRQKAEMEACEPRLRSGLDRIHRLQRAPDCITSYIDQDGVYIAVADFLYMELTDTTLEMWGEGGYYSIEHF